MTSFKRTQRKYVQSRTARIDNTTARNPYTADP